MKSAASVIAHLPLPPPELPPPAEPSRTRRPHRAQPRWRPTGQRWCQACDQYESEAGMWEEGRCPQCRMVRRAIGPKAMAPWRSNPYLNCATTTERFFLKSVCQRMARLLAAGKAAPFRAHVRPGTETHQYPDIVFQVGYAGVRDVLGLGCKRTAERLMQSLSRKHFLSPALRTTGGNPDTGRKRCDTREATWWVYHHDFERVLALRRDDDRIAHDSKGNRYHRGRGRKLLTPGEKQLWRIDEQLAAGMPELPEAEVAPLPDDGEEAERRPRTPSPQTRLKLAPEPAAAPAEEEPPESIRTVLARWGIAVQNRVLARWVAEMKSRATMAGHELSDALLAAIMQKCAQNSRRPPEGFGYFRAAVPSVLIEKLVAHRALAAQREAAAVEQVQDAERAGAALQAEAERLRSQIAELEERRAKLRHKPSVGRHAAEAKQRELAQIEESLTGCRRELQGCAP